MSKSRNNANFRRYDNYDRNRYYRQSKRQREYDDFSARQNEADGWFYSDKEDDEEMYELARCAVGGDRDWMDYV